MEDQFTIAVKLGLLDSKGVGVHIHPLQAELLALNEGLVMAKIHKPQTNLEIETDSTEVVIYIDQNNTTYADIIHEHRLLMLQLMSPGIRHNF